MNAVTILHPQDPVLTEEGQRKVNYWIDDMCIRYKMSCECTYRQVGALLLYDILCRNGICVQIQLRMGRDWRYE